MLWTSQGAYYAANANHYSVAVQTEAAKVSTFFAATFAAFYLASETGFKLIATAIFLLEDGKSNWKPIVFGLYAAAAFCSAMGFALLVLPLKDIDFVTSNYIGNSTDLVGNDIAGRANLQFSSDNSSGKRISARIKWPEKGEMTTNVCGVFRAMLSSRLLQLLLPYQVCFGFSSGLINTYVTAVIVKESLGDGYIGLLAGISTLTAVLMAAPIAYFSNYVKHGKAYVMVFGALCFLFAGLPILITNNETIGNWNFIVVYFMIHGAARGIWENTNKSVVVDYFTDSSDRELAFAAIYFASGLAGAFGFLFFAVMNREGLAALNVTVSVIALVSYLLSYRVYLGTQRMKPTVGDGNDSMNFT